jgi:hypothetical protein
MEKRRQIRFLAKENAFAALGAKFTKVGRVKNISTGGLAFEYITDGDGEDNASQLDLFVSGEEFHLPKIPCRVIYDIPARRSNGNRIFFQPFLTKQCGVKFETLTEEKKAKLDLFIEMHTIGVAPGVAATKSAM